MAKSINLKGNLIGRFYFKQTVNGNLIGEYSNNKSKFVAAESAEPIKQTCGFVGEYKAVWQDREATYLATLKISYKFAESTQIYSLRWDYEGGFFIGEGFLVDGMLIGDYRDFEIE